MVLKAIGFILAFSLFLLILGSVFTGTIWENLLLIGLMLLLNILIAIVLPRVSKSAVVEEMAAGIRLFGELVNRVVVGAVLVIVYVFGVGPVWLFFRIAGKKFLSISLPPNTSTWIKREKKKINFDEMF